MDPNDPPSPDQQPTSAPTDPLPQSPPHSSPVNVRVQSALNSEAHEKTENYSIDHLGLDPVGRTVRVGHYLLKRVIGFGGMGTVYEAVQDQPRRSVAIKLMRNPLTSRANRHRFEHESQLLARLRHPGIAQVFEAGTHHHGEGDAAIDVPFYAMEFIPGARGISEYVALKKLSEPEIVALFALVCDAVHHAHEKGVLHRDLKPGNILVETAVGQPKVIDFGIARSVDGIETTEPTLQTSAHQLLGTVQYMSPEQLDSDPSELDARSDVYSLGIVLYELLCNRLPYDIGRANVPDATKIIREQEPILPRALRPAINPDLEIVLLKALDKDVTRRYSSAAEFAADLRRVLADQPVHARRDSPVYAVRKYWQRVTRHHWFLSAVFLWIAVLLGARQVFNALNDPLRISRGYERFVTSRLHTFNQSQLANVRVVAIHENTDFEALATRADVQGVSNADPETVRRLHARLLERLRDSGVRVVTFDIRFRSLSPANDAPLAKASAALREAGIDVVVGARTWDAAATGGGTAADPDERFPGQLSSLLRPQVQIGCYAIDAAGDSPWSLQLTVRHPGGEPLPSLALQTLSSYRRPGHAARIALDAGMQYLELTLASGTAGAAATPPAQTRQPALQPVQLTDVTVARDEPGFGLDKTDNIGSYALEIPPTPVLEASTIDYAQALTASPEQLRSWFDGKVALIGDVRRDKDGPFPHPDGRRLPGIYAHAVGIDSLLSSRPILRPRFVDLFGIVMRGEYLFDALIVAGGIVAGVALARRRASWYAALGITVLLIAAVIASALGAYELQRILYTPFTACLGLAAGVLLGWGLLRSTARPRAAVHV